MKKILNFIKIYNNKMILNRIYNKIQNNNKLINNKIYKIFKIYKIQNIKMNNNKTSQNNDN